MTRRVFALAGLALLFAASSVSGLELTKGKIRLDLMQNTGRFIAYYHASANTWTPLFYAPDPRTTVLELRVGKKLYRMGDSSRFRDKVTRLQNGGEIRWSSKELEVTERFHFEASRGSKTADGFLITIGITNRGSAPLSVGARYLIDTSLGEQSRIEFVTPSDGSMSNETGFRGAGVPAYWISPLNQRMSVALEAVLRAPGVTLPNRIIFANWKRLYRSGWSYTVDPSRNFNLLPYSINDSAVAMYYDPAILAPGATRTITLLLGQHSESGWSGGVGSGTAAGQPAAPKPAPAATAQPSPRTPQGAAPRSTAPQAPSSEQAPSRQQQGGAAPQPSAAAPQQPKSGTSPAASPAPHSSTGAAAGQPRTSVLSNLASVDQTLQRIQKMLDNPGSVSQTDLDSLKKELEQLNAQKSRTQKQ